MAATYVKFETPKEIIEKTKELLTIAKDTGRVRKGANETTKSIEKGNAKLVVIAEDVSPPEVVVHLPSLCEEKGVMYLYFPTRQELGSSVGLSVGSAAVSVEDAGNAGALLKEITEKLGRRAKPEQEGQEEKQKEKVEPKKGSGESGSKEAKEEPEKKAEGEKQ